jgi:Lon protease-like protein
MKPEFPKLIPIFPLSGVIYFPKTNLPLNIFEKRYLSLINDAMKTNKLMGMVQSIRGGEEVYKVGCLGKISDFRKSEDGRIIVNLTGLTRFEIKQEISSPKLYREFDVQYEKFGSDIEINTNDLKKSDLDLLFEKSKDFFKRSGLMLNWKELEKLDQDQQINTLAMISPISNEEKQKLLETVTLNEKIQTLSSIIEFYLYERITDKTTIQ